MHISLIIIGVVLIVALGFTGYARIEYTNTKKAENKNSSTKSPQSSEDSKSLYEATLEEVETINKNSNLLGAVLLSKPSKKIPSETPTFLPQDKEGNKGYYYVSIYHKASVITQISLESPDTNVLGIAVGDNKQVIVDKLKDTAFELSDPVPDYQMVCTAYHVSLSFKLSDDGKIESILVYVNDPNEETPTY
jgi:hypothetical protein